MKFLFDLIPVFLFFIAYKLGEVFPTETHALITHALSSVIKGGEVAVDIAPVLLATCVAMLTSVIQISYMLLRRIKIDGMLWMSTAIIAVFGSATIYFHNPVFIKVKPTILYWCFALGMLGSQLIFKKNMIRSMMEEQVKLPDLVWTQLIYAYVICFFSQGVLNLIMGFMVFKTQAQFGSWTTFKAFGQPAIFFVFIVFQTIYLSRHMQDEA